MTPRRKRRLLATLGIVAGMGIAVAFALNAFRQNLLFFFSPSQVLAGEAPPNHAFRVGGLVVGGSVLRTPGVLTVHFKVTDTVNQLAVEYDGILPDLFREGQGIVAQGELRDDGVFVASEVLAKHDENYMPPEVADAIDTARRGKSANTEAAN